jgi:hypothetical protein
MKSNPTTRTNQLDSLAANLNTYKSWLKYAILNMALVIFQHIGRYNFSIPNYSCTYRIVISSMYAYQYSYQTWLIELSSN